MFPQRLDNELLQDSLLHVRRSGHGDVEDNILHFSCMDALDEPLGALWYRRAKRLPVHSLANQCCEDTFSPVPGDRLSSYTPPFKRSRNARTFRGVPLPKPQTGGEVPEGAQGLGGARQQAAVQRKYAHLCPRGAVRLAFWRSSFAIAPVWGSNDSTAPNASPSVRVTYAVARRPSSAACIFPSIMHREARVAVGCCRTEGEQRSNW